MARKKLGQMLVEAGVIDEASVRAALGEQQRWGGSLGRALIEMRLIDEPTLIATLSSQLNFPTVDLDQVVIPRSVIDLVAGETCERHSIIPFAQPFKFLDVAMAEPTNLGIIDELRIRTQLNVRTYLAGPKMLERALRKYYGRGMAWGGEASTGQSGAFEVTHSGGGRVTRTRADSGGPLDAPAAPPPVRSRPPTMSNYAPLPDPDLSLGRARIDRDRERDAEIAALQGRLSRLEAMVARDEDVLRKLMALLVDKELATREEILERIST